jgi:hypothetical protein
MQTSYTTTQILYFVVAIGSGIVAFLFGRDFIAGNADATNVIVTVFSILAGFLIAVMTLLGDQSILPGSWKISEIQRKKIKVKLIRQKWLFYLYLLTLSVIFVASLLRAQFPETTGWLERVYFGLAVVAFLLSFRLPATLMEVQMDRVDAVVGARRQQSSKLDRS